MSVCHNIIFSKHIMTKIQTAPKKDPTQIISQQNKPPAKRANQTNKHNHQYEASTTKQKFI